MIVSLLILAWVLTLFGFDNIVINGIYELFGIKISKSGYYIVFLIFSILLDILRYVPRGRYL
jgi:hypothetical protein